MKLSTRFLALIFLFCYSEKAFATKGYLKIFTGPMFSGKTAELINLLGAFDSRGKKVLTCFHEIGKRNGKDALISRIGTERKAKAIGNDDCSFLLSEDCAQFDVIGIDEVQFFSAESGIISVILELIQRNKIVIISGLDLDFRGLAFGPICELINYSVETIRLKAVCSLCHSVEAVFTQRLVSGRSLLDKKEVLDSVIVPDSEGSCTYQPRCGKCYVSPLLFVDGTLNTSDC